VGYLIGFVWGVTCHAFLGLYSVICSRHLGGKKEVFALNRLVYTLSIMLYQLDKTYSGSNITYETLFVLRSCCVLSFFLLAWLPAPQLHPEPKKGK
jgi:drug/metabolite transporter (DMT)-like permease